MAVKFLLMFFCIALALTLHELGHFIAGVLCRAKIKSFNLFASPGFHLFSTHDKWVLKLFPVLSEHVELKIGWLPLLAYVRFEEKPSPSDNSQCYLMNKPAWQRLVIFSAGVFVNFIFAIVIDMCLFAHYVPNEKNIAKIAWSSTSYVSKRTWQTATSYVGNISDKVVDMIDVDSDSEAINDASNTKRNDSVVIGKGDYYKLANHFPSRIRFTRLAHLLISINIALIVFNVFPIPPLDGGQILFAAYESIVRRPPNERFKLGVTLLGLIFLAANMAYIIYDEVVKDFNIHGLLNI